MSRTGDMKLIDNFTARPHTNSYQLEDEKEMAAATLSRSYGNKM
jgi:hypothetical protein